MATSKTGKTGNKNKVRQPVQYMDDFRTGERIKYNPNATGFQGGEVVPVRKVTRYVGEGKESGGSNPPNRIDKKIQPTVTKNYHEAWKNTYKKAVTEQAKKSNKTNRNVRNLKK